VIPLNNLFDRLVEGTGCSMSSIKRIVKKGSSKPPSLFHQENPLKSRLQRVLLMSLKKKLLGELFITLQLFKKEKH
jgi:hypothetical protein